MFTESTHPTPPTRMQRLLGAYRVLHARGALLDGPAYRPAIRSAEVAAIHATQPTPSAPQRCSSDELVLFVTRLRQLLAATAELDRRQLEKDVLALAAPMQADGLFEIFHIAHPALATMVADHLATPGPLQNRGTPLAG